jgi:farnesyl-diphosphate farnesyltransferase
VTIRLLPTVSRTFALSIETLPAGLRAPVRLAYLLCRVVDTIEDEPLVTLAAGAPLTAGAARRAALFDAFDAQLADDGAPPADFVAAAAGIGRAADADLLAHADAVLRAWRALPDAARAAVRPMVLEMSRGMRAYAARADAAGGRLALDDLDDLERYCWYVAGTVGVLLTALFEGALPPLAPAAQRTVRGAAVGFGLGLQLVNIVKDVAADLERGACFLPQDRLRAHGLSADRGLLAPERRDDALAVLGEVCERAREHLDAAVTYTLAWPLPEGAPVRRFCAVPLALAFATLRAVERGDDTLQPGRTPKVSRLTVAQVCAAAGAAVRDDGELRALFARHR